MDYQPVGFESEGARLGGRLYLPAGEPPFPAVAMAHGTSATITMCADRYAEAIAGAGIAALLYDHRNFGISEGEPRQQINPWLQARGYRHALDFLSSRPEINEDRLGVWGDSYTGGLVLLVAATDDRVRVVVAQCPACGPALPPPDPTGERFARIRSTFLDGDITGPNGSVAGPMPVVYADQMHHESLLKPVSAFRWFIEYGGRHASGWQNVVTRMSPSVPEPYHAGLCAAHVSVPVLALISPDDEMEGANPVVARAVFEAIRGPVHIEDLEGGHFGLLHHPSPEFDLASRRQTSFLRAHL